MTMYNPPHPGELIRDVYLEATDLSVRQIAENMDVSASTLNRLVNGNSSVSPEMAIRLSICLGRSPESWLSMQDHYDLWIAKKQLNVKKLKQIQFAA